MQEHSSGEHSEEEHSSEQQEEEEAAMEQLSRTNFLAPNGEGRAMRRTRQVSPVCSVLCAERCVQCGVC